MPSRAPLPIPAAMLPGGPLNPVDWIGAGGNDLSGSVQSALMRGSPEPLAYWQRRQIAGDDTIAQGLPVFFQSRPYDRGADAFAPHFGKLNINPIGAGVYAPYRLPTIAGPGARYAFGAIWFDVQTIPTTMAPGPTMSVESLDALLATSTVGASYQTTG